MKRKKTKRKQQKCDMVKVLDTVERAVSTAKKVYRDRVGCERSQIGGSPDKRTDVAPVVMRPGLSDSGRRNHGNVCDPIR